MPSLQLDENVDFEREREATVKDLMMDSDEDSQWEPDEAAINNPETYRINTWEKTVLGKDYQELRVQKRERRQPSTIPDLPYLHWERTGAPPAGPYSALDTKELEAVQQLVKPDPEKYFAQRPGSQGLAPKLPALGDTIRAAFDEKALFPSYILDFERNMKNYHSMMLSGPQKPKNTRANLQNVITPAGQTGAPAPRVAPSPRKGVKAVVAVKMKAILGQTSRSSVSTHGDSSM